MGTSDTQIKIYANQHKIPVNEARISLNSMNGAQYNKAIAGLNGKSGTGTLGLNSSSLDPFAVPTGLPSITRQTDVGLNIPSTTYPGASAGEATFNPSVGAVSTTYDPSGLKLDTGNIDTSVGPLASNNGYNSNQLGSGLGSVNGPTNYALADEGFVSSLADDGYDINSLSQTDVLDKYKGYNDTSSNIFGNGEGQIGFNTGTLGAVTGLGQLGLGIAQYYDGKELRDEQLTSLKQNREFAADDKLVNDNYRAGYGA